MQNFGTFKGSLRQPALAVFVVITGLANKMKRRNVIRGESLKPGKLSIREFI